MRPSELRRQQRRAWLGLLMICLVFVVVAMVSAWASGRFVSPRHMPELPQQETPEVVAARAPAPEHVVREHAAAIKRIASEVGHILDSRRSVEIGGAVAFIDGGVELGDFARISDSGQSYLLLVVYERDLASGGRISLRTYTREGTSWMAQGEPIATMEFESDAAARYALSGTQGVTIRNAGAGVAAVTIPTQRRCDPSATSDHERARSLYVALGAKSSLLLNHVSAGERGNRPGDTAEIQLLWRELDGLVGTGEIVLTKSRPGSVQSNAGFAYRAFKFRPTENPAEILRERERALDDFDGPGGQAQLRDLIEDVGLLTAIEGRLDYCVTMPHRIAATESLDRRRWNERLEEREFELRLKLATILARAGEGMTALAAFELEDPALILTGSARRRELLELIKGPKIASVQMVSGLQLLPRPSLQSSTERHHQMRWLDADRLFVPAYPTRDALVVELDTLTRSAASGTLVGATYRQRPASSPLIVACASGALWSGLERRLAAANARSSAVGVRREARAIGEEMAAAEGRYNGRLLRTFSVSKGTWSRAEREAHRVLVAEMAPWDRLPEGGVLVDIGVTCAGGFLQLCTGESAECAAEIEPSFAADRPPGAAHQTHVFPIAEERNIPCYPTETPSKRSPDPVLDGWLDPHHAVLRAGHDYFVIGLTDGDATVDEVEPVYPSPETATVGWPWLEVGTGAAERFTVGADDFGLWLYDRVAERELLLQWWSALPIERPIGAWQGRVSPSGKHLALWTEQDGLWIGQLGALPAPLE